MKKIKILIIKWFGKKRGARYCPHICRFCEFKNDCDFWEYSYKVKK